MSEKLCAISIDLDPITAYYKIHGLGDPPRHLRSTIMLKVLPRFLELFELLNVRVTFFVVASELEQNEEAIALLKQAVDAGHEIANHTYHHPYDLCRLPEQVIEQEIRRAHDLISDSLNVAPEGFRTPGYSTNANVMRVLANMGYLYDSSMFPSAPYYAAKVAVMAGMSMRGRNSGAVLGDPRCLLAPTDPYRPDAKEPWKKGQCPVVELPVAVLPYSRLPAIGTLVAAGPRWLRGHLMKAMCKRSFFNFELHGIDLADAIADRIPTVLAGRQPDLRVPYADKREIFRQTIEVLQREFEIVPLRDVGTTFQREGTI